MSAEQPKVITGLAMLRDEYDNDPAFLRGDELPPEEDDDEEWQFPKATLVIFPVEREPLYTESQVRAMVEEKIADLKWALQWIERELKHLRVDQNIPQPVGEQKVSRIAAKHGIKL